ncbi:MAG: glycoside hydrolase family 38 C-terminal domain-containing protein, partial [Acidimicrobiales bacterium]
TSWDSAKFEVPAQRWASLEERGFGVALLNDCKHGYDVRRNVMRLSLLRGPGWPDPEADAGGHRFSYAIFPFGASAGSEQLVDEAEAFNLPLRAAVACAGSDGGTLEPAGSFVRLDGATLSAVKRADDGSGDLVVRLYEHLGSHRRATLSGFHEERASLVDLLERHLADVAITDGAITLDLGPFELVTLRLTPR